jgi:hypothetical protein
VGDTVIGKTSLNQPKICHSCRFLIDFTDIQKFLLKNKFCFMTSQSYLGFWFLYSFPEVGIVLYTFGAFNLLSLEQ